jgi:hypothetical protein
LTSAAGTIAIGTDALGALTTGARNIAIGYQAASTITDATDNIMIGHLAGAAAEDANFFANIGIGTFVFDGVAADVDTTGNVAIGFGSMTGTLVDAADYNTCVGYLTGQIMTGGHSNVLLGAGCGTGLTTGYQNIIIGRDAAGNADDDYSHVIIGHSAGGVLNSGNGCVLIGKDVEPSTAAASNQIVIGQDAVGHGNNIAVIGNTSMTAWHPPDDAGVDLGSASYRFANLYTADIQLSNEDTPGNEVDGTTGNWTLQEGQDDIFIINRKTGKKYKFKLEEIT